MAPGFTLPPMPPRAAPPIPATSAGKNNVFLVDGYALIYRAFFAMIARPLTTKSGENTSAVWGITNFLLRLYENYHPEYIGWVHDRGVSFRQEQYPEYKATREKLGEELQQDFDRSLERVCQILDAFRIPVLAIDGYEADDVVATLAERAANTGMQAVIVSGDKDFYQLIRPGVALLNPGRGGQAPAGSPAVSGGQRAVVAPARDAAAQRAGRAGPGAVARSPARRGSPDFAFQRARVPHAHSQACRSRTGRRGGSDRLGAESGGCGPAAGVGGSARCRRCRRASCHVRRAASRASRFHQGRARPGRDIVRIGARTVLVSATGSPRARR